MLAQASPLREESTASPNKALPTKPHQSDRPTKRRKVCSSPTNEESEPLELFPRSSSSTAGISLHARPQFLFPRAKLPLYFLDASSALNSRFYSANIHVLEQQSSSSWLLITNLDNERELFAVERIRHGLYSLSRLAEWVNTTTLKAHAVSFGETEGRDVCYSSLHTNSPRGHDFSQWWSAAAIPHGSLERQPQTATTTSAAVAGAALDNKAMQRLQETQATLPPAVDPDQLSEAQPSFEEIKSFIIQQYLDCLYCSKAPVTFFAKSALSRARAVARAANCSQDLANFLRSLVLTIPMAEQKYKTAISDIIITSYTPFDQAPTETSSPSRTVAVKKKKTKRLKPQKNGIFPGEEDFIKSWWSNIDCIPVHPGEASSRTTQDSLVGRLRFRETLLQLVLSFEALYIESSPEISQVTERKVDEQTEVASTPEPLRTKRPRDLAKLIDILIDKSIIWQSIDTSHVSDQLRDFHLQLLRPFYGARLPVLVTQVGKKLGVSSGLSAKEPSGGQTSGKVSKIAPGTEISRSSATMKGRKSLQRVSSETLNAKRAPTSLLRSMTDSMVSKAAFELERNPNDPAVESSTVIPEEHSMSRGTSVTRDDVSHRSLSRSNSISVSQREDSHRPLSRSGSVNLSSQNLKQREVDLSAVAKFKRAKPKKAGVEQELQDAIAALKKPNRSLAARKYMDAAENRASASQPRLKASRNAVEVSSTPRRPGKAPQGITATPHRTKLSNYELHPGQVPATSPFVPMSAIKNGDLPGHGNVAVKQQSLVASTPSAKVRPRSIFETPSRKQEHTSLSTPKVDKPAGEQSMSEQGLTQTPTKPPKMNTYKARVEQVQPTESSASIYDVLGWDNDVDELA